MPTTHEYEIAAYLSRWWAGEPRLERCRRLAALAYQWSRTKPEEATYCDPAAYARLHAIAAVRASRCL